MLNNIHRLASEDFTPHANLLLSQPPTFQQEISDHAPNS